MPALLGKDHPTRRPKLSAFQGKILVALLKLHAISHSTLKKQLIIRHFINPKLPRDGRPFSSLCKKRLAKSADGKGGGYWLTDVGRSEAQLLSTEGIK